jgi:hypothetical protein
MFNKLMHAGLGCLLAAALFAQQAQSQTAPAPLVRILSVSRPPTVSIAGKYGESSGKWLLVEVEVTPPSADFSVEKLALVASNGDVHKPVALDGARPKGEEHIFLGIKDQPGILEHWVRLRTVEGGAYFGAGWYDANDKLAFIWSADSKLMFQGTSAVSLFLLFEVPADPASYRLLVGESHIDLPASIK